MFSVRQRDDLQVRLRHRAEQDRRVVAAATVGSLAVDGGGDRWSDVDFTMAVADHAEVIDVLEDWTRDLVDEVDAVHLVDLRSGPTVYRVLLLPGALQVDLSMTPASLFRPTGPRFRLLFGPTAPLDRAPVDRPAAWTSIPVPVLAPDLFGWAVVYALHGRACIERGRLWQAEHYVGAVRDLALTLACLHHGPPAAQARGYDDLPADVLIHFRGTHVAGHEPHALRAALAASVHALAQRATAAGLPNSHTVAERLMEGGLTPAAT